MSLKRHRQIPVRRPSWTKPRGVNAVSSFGPSRSLLKSKMPEAWKEGQAKIDQEGKCRRCGEPSRKSENGKELALHPHHIVHKGSPFLGDDHEDNCCPLCAGCHRLWHDKKGFDLWLILHTAEKRHAMEQLGTTGARELLWPSTSPKRVAA